MDGPETKTTESVEVPKETNVIKEDDIKFLIDECEVSREAAESLLRANGCDLKRSIQAYIKSPLVIN
eukprot:gene6875-4950_t